MELTHPQMKLGDGATAQSRSDVRVPIHLPNPQSLLVRFVSWPIKPSGLPCNISYGQKSRDTWIKILKTSFKTQASTIFTIRPLSSRRRQISIRATTKDQFPHRSFYTHQRTIQGVLKRSESPSQAIASSRPRLESKDFLETLQSARVLQM